MRKFILIAAMALASATSALAGDLRSLSLTGVGRKGPCRARQGGGSAEDRGGAEAAGYCPNRRKRKAAETAKPVEAPKPPKRKAATPNVARPAPTKTEPSKTNPAKPVRSRSRTTSRSPPRNASGRGRASRKPPRPTSRAASACTGTKRASCANSIATASWPAAGRRLVKPKTKALGDDPGAFCFLRIDVSANPSPSARRC